MDLVSGVVVFILLWWWVFLMALPFGVKAPDEIEPGHASSAPERPRIRLKMLIATVIASGLFIIVYWIIESGFISMSSL
jgi:predicted secreted protein